MANKRSKRNKATQPTIKEESLEMENLEPEQEVIVEGQTTEQPVEPQVDESTPPVDTDDQTIEEPVAVEQSSDDASEEQAVITPSALSNDVDEKVKSLFPTNIEAALENVTDYAKNMAPNVPTTADSIKSRQRSLYQSVYTILTYTGDNAKEALLELLVIYHANKDACFTDRLICRYVDEVTTLTSTQRGFLNMITVILREISDPSQRHSVAKGLDLKIIKKFLPDDTGDIVFNKLNQICNISG